MKRFNFTYLANLPAKEKRITVPTLFTLLRIVCIPLIVGAMLCDNWGYALLWFIIAALSDTIDGTLARLTNNKTFLGAALDPLADKLLVISCFVTLAFAQSALFAIPLWFLVLVILKEILLVGGVIIIFVFQGHIDITPTWLAKRTTLLQVCFIGWLFACYYFHWIPLRTYYAMLSLVTVAVICSFGQYVSIGLRMVNGYKV